MRVKRILSLILIPLTVFAATLLSACGDETGSPAASAEESGIPTVAEPLATPTPTPKPAPTPAPKPTAEPYAGPDLPERERVEDDFFSDAAFFGNSLVGGLSLYGGLEQGDFCAVTSASVVSVGLTKNSTFTDGSAATMLESLAEKQYGKVYILLGINEIGFEPDRFIELYGNMLDEIAGSEPDADIYIMSLTPVTEEKSDEGELFSMERIGRYNEALRRLAQERECYFIDLCAALAGEDGYLPPEQSTDGIHLRQEKYPEWAEYLRTHYE